MSPDSAPAPAIRIRALSKRFGRLIAVKDLSLEVPQGEVFGFLGLNGAGKTTTIRLLLDLLRPTSGAALVFGMDCRTQGLEVRARVGYMPGEMGFYGEMTGRQILDLFAGLGAMPVQQQYREDLLDRLELPAADLQRKLRDYSTGMKRKLGLVQALQADPPLLILDEPTEGLDPLMQESFYRLLLDLRSRGRTVFMSSHVLSEIERICGRVALIRRGKLVLLSTVDEIRRMAPRRVRVYFGQDVRQIPERLPKGFEMLEAGPRCWTLRAHDPLGPLVEFVAGLPVYDIEVAEPRLEEILLKYYREDGL